MYYKLTDRDMWTRGTEWVMNKWYCIDPMNRSKNAELRTKSWFHCYDDPIVAIMRNPMKVTWQISPPG